MVSELYSAIQLLATLTIGFVILGYSEFFYDLLRTKFFHADETISDACKECMCLIPDKTTRDALQPTNIGEGSTRPRIEQLKIDCEKLERRINNFEEAAKEKLKEKCNTRSMASMCLFVFMASVLFLFVPIILKLYGAIVELFVLSFSILGILYLILGWCFGEKDNKCLLTKFESISHPIVSFFIFSVLSVIFVLLFTFLIKADFKDLWKYTHVLFILLGWLNFVIYALIIKSAVKKFKNDVNTKKSLILSECKRVNGNYSAMLIVAEEAQRASVFSENKPNP